jgi:teichuronic acid biosynthesis glycosyltransferase TuaC
MRVLVVAEFYPREEDPVLGVWAHRQALAARDAGAEIQVVVLHRLVPARRDVAGGPRMALRSLRSKVAQPRSTVLDGLAVRYVPYVSPPRSRSYGSWGAWAAPLLRRAVAAAAPFDLVHAHNAVPPGDAARRLGLACPLVVSVHGGDVFHTAARSANVARTFAAARLVLANSEGTAERARRLGAGPVRVVHLGTDLPELPPREARPPTLVTVGHLVARKRHGDVLRALAGLEGVRYDVVGDGPERERLEALAHALGIAGRVRFLGQLPHDQALRAVARCDVFALPSTDEAFGVAYVEAMAAGLPAIGLAGEPGPEEIARAGGGMLLVAPDDPRALRAAIERALAHRAELGAAARATVEQGFTWERCGRETIAAYADAVSAA